jgi:hypothetical protein
VVRFSCSHCRRLGAQVGFPPQHAKIARAGDPGLTAENRPSRFCRFAPNRCSALHVVTFSCSCCGRRRANSASHPSTRESRVPGPSASPPKSTQQSAFSNQQSAISIQPRSGVGALSTEVRVGVNQQTQIPPGRTKAAAIPIASSRYDTRTPSPTPQLVFERSWTLLRKNSHSSNHHSPSRMGRSPRK